MVERPNTVAGLVAKRQEIAREIAALRAQLRERQNDLEHIDHAIRIFDPTGEVAVPQVARPQGRDVAHKGEMRRYVLAFLREAAPREVTSLDIAVRIAKDRGMSAADRRYVVMMRRRVIACLNKLRRKGMVREVPLQGEYKGWALAR